MANQYDQQDQQDLQDQQLAFSDYIVNELNSIIQNNTSTSIKCSSIIEHLYSASIYQELIFTVTLNNNLFNRNPTPQLLYHCSELFENCSQEFIDYVFDNRAQLSDDQRQIKNGLFRNLIALIDLDCISETISGYFYNVMNSFIQKRGSDVWNYLENDQRTISSFLKHVDQIHICRVITELLIFGYQPKQFLDYSYLSQQISKRLLKLMIKKQHLNIIVDNISEIFIEIFKRKKQNENLDISQIIQIFQDPQNLFEVAIQSNSEGPYSILKLLLEYLRNYQKDQLHLFIHILKFIPQEFKNTYQNNKYQDTYFDKLFGRKNMILLHLTSQLIQLNYIQISSELVKPDFINILLNLIIQFPYHNQLHYNTILILQTIIENNQSEQIQIVIDLLLKFIVEQLSQTQQVVGFKGFLSQLANYLIDKQNNAIILQAMKKNVLWEQFCEVNLKKINQLEQQFLFNFNPRDPIVTEQTLSQNLQEEERIEQEQQQQQQILYQEQNQKCDQLEQEVQSS